MSEINQADGAPLQRNVRPLVERLRSRAREDRQHRKYREEAAREIERLQAGYREIAAASDSQMQDGDLAREIADRMIGA